MLYTNSISLFKNNFASAFQCNVAYGGSTVQVEICDEYAIGYVNIILLKRNGTRHKTNLVGSFCYLPKRLALNIQLSPSVCAVRRPVKL